ncbi:hypothetical protein AAY473_035791 [Plecturocebus cupreus]
MEMMELGLLSPIHLPGKQEQLLLPPWAAGGPPGLGRGASAPAGWVFWGPCPSPPGSVHTRHRRWADRVAGTAVQPSICCHRLGADGLPNEGVLHAQMPAICRGLLRGGASTPCQTDPGTWATPPPLLQGRGSQKGWGYAPNGTRQGGGDTEPCGAALESASSLSSASPATADPGDSLRLQPRTSPAGSPGAQDPETRDGGRSHQGHTRTLAPSAPAVSTGRKPAKPNSREMPPESRLSVAPPIAVRPSALLWQPRPASAFPEPARRRLCARGWVPASSPLPRGAALCRGCPVATRSSWGVRGWWKQGRKKPNQSLLTPAPTRRPGAEKPWPPPLPTELLSPRPGPFLTRLPPPATRFL